MPRLAERDDRRSGSEAESGLQGRSRFGVLIIGRVGVDTERHPSRITVSVVVGDRTSVDTCCEHLSDGEVTQEVEVIRPTLFGRQLPSLLLGSVPSWSFHLTAQPG